MTDDPRIDLQQLWLAYELAYVNSKILRRNRVELLTSGGYVSNEMLEREAAVSRTLVEARAALVEGPGVVAEAAPHRQCVRLDFRASGARTSVTTDLGRLVRAIEAYTEAAQRIAKRYKTRIVPTDAEVDREADARVIMVAAGRLVRSRNSQPFQGSG